MSKAAKGLPPGGSVDTPDLPFEEALQKLEAIAEAMEADDLPLATLLSRYEEGMKLSEVCQARLRAAEVRIQQLEAKAAAEPVLKPFRPAVDNVDEQA
jgi:exodeoxyribonuclease VII small subunit